MLDEKRRGILIALQESLEINFQNLQLLNQAFVHESYANERRDLKLVSNERLEFLGDSVLGVIVTEYIYNRYPQAPEGDLNRIRAAVVSRPTLAEKAAELDLGKYLLLSKGEGAGGGRQRASLLADAYEALIGVVFLDLGLEKAKKFVLQQLIDKIDLAEKNQLFKDYKSILQELAQKEFKCCPSYQVVKEEGPDHCKIFSIEVVLNEKTLGAGKGKSKKEAEQEAARQALTRLK